VRTLLVFGFLLVGCGSKGEHPRVRIANGGGTGLQMWCLPVTLAGTLGYYKEEGLDVDLENLPTAVKAQEAVVGGSADVEANTYDGDVNMAAEGQHVKAFFIITRRDGKVLIVAPAANGKILRPEDLKGATIGVGNLGSMANRWMTRYLAAHGLHPPQFRAVGIGYGASALAAIEMGRVEAAALTGGDHFHLLRRHPGLRVLTDSSTPEGMRETYGDTFAGGALSARQEWLDHNPDAARHLARALQRTLQWLGTHTPDEIRASMPEQMRSQDAGVDVEIIRWGREAYTTDGAMPEGAPEVVKRYLDSVIPKVRDSKIDLASTWTNEYLPGAK
jgi:NitT/TauT family transport system substrate-binding protein